MRGTLTLGEIQIETERQEGGSEREGKSERKRERVCLAPSPHHTHYVGLLCYRCLSPLTGTTEPSLDKSHKHHTRVVWLRTTKSALDVSSSREPKSILGIRTHVQSLNIRPETAQPYLQ